MLRRISSGSKDQTKLARTGGQAIQFHHQLGVLSHEKQLFSSKELTSQPFFGLCTWLKAAPPNNPKFDLRLTSENMKLEAHIINSLRCRPAVFFSTVLNPPTAFTSP